MTIVQNGTDAAAEIENPDTCIKVPIVSGNRSVIRRVNPDNVKGLPNEMDREINRKGNQAGNAQRIKAYRQKHCDAVLSGKSRCLDNNLTCITAL